MSYQFYTDSRMAVTRRAYIFGAFLSSVLSVLLIVISVSSDSWGMMTDSSLFQIVSSASTDVQVTDSSINYGVFGGEFVINTLATPNYNALYMTCVPDIGVCAVSCKTDAVARELEVRALAVGFRVSVACASVTEVNITDPLPVPPVISFGIYVSTLLFLFLQLVFAVVTAGLAITNATMNPTEPIFGLPGCLWSNVVTSCLGLLVLFIFGIYWATSSLQLHLAFSYIALGEFVPDPALGYSYWLLLVAVLCTLANIGLLQLRTYLLERDPPPPTIKVENHSDGTIFLY